MTYRLTTGPRVGGWRTAALIETRRDIAGGRHGAWVRASIAPVAVFLMRDQEIGAADVAGNALDLSVLEGLYPGLSDQIARFA